MEEMVNGITEFLDLAAIFLLDASEVRVALKSFARKEKTHAAGNLTGAGITETAGPPFDRAVAKPDMLHNVFVTPGFDIFTHFGLRDIHDWEFETTEERNEIGIAMLRVDTMIAVELSELLNNSGAGALFRTGGTFDTDGDIGRLGAILLNIARKIAILIAERALTGRETIEKGLEGLSNIFVDSDILERNDAKRQKAPFGDALGDEMGEFFESGELIFAALATRIIDVDRLDGETGAHETNNHKSRIPAASPEGVADRGVLG